jgi:hypothetical protein
LRPKVYFRLTDNRPDLSLRFVTHDHGIREVKDAFARELLAGIEYQMASNAP